MTTRIFFAGRRGMAGSVLLRQFSKESDVMLLLESRSELDLTDGAAVQKYMQRHRPDQVYLVVAKVGGIHANNTYPAEFITGVHKLLFLGSSCVYPQLAKQPMSEDCLLTGRLEPTNEPYAIAKIAGIKMCESYNRQYGVDYRCAMLTNLYGENDNFQPKNSHVIPALKFNAQNIK